MYKMRYSVNGKKLLVRIAATFMLLSVMFRVIGYWGFWKNQTACFNYMQLLLPVLCCIGYAVIIMCFGEKHFSLTIVPVLLGVVFFIVKATDLKVIPMLACMVMSLIFAVIYVSTIFGGLETRWPLISAVGLPLLYQLIIRDGATLLASENAMTMDEFIPELSVLCILISLLITSLVMKKCAVEGTETVEGEVLDDNGEVQEEAPLLLDSLPAEELAEEAEAESAAKPQEESEKC